MLRQYWKWNVLGERVGDILGAVDLGELEYALLNHVAEEIEPRVDVTTPGRVDRVVRHRYARRIVLVEDRGCLLSVAETTEHAGCDKLRLCRAQRHARLTLSLPGNGAIVEAADVTGNGLACVRVTGKVGIHPAHEHIALARARVAVGDALGGRAA
eukprot:1016346-Rhodomonas_salina.2